MSKDRKKPVEDESSIPEDLFCIGFSYGVRYGYEGIFTGEMSKSEIAGHWLLAKGLYQKLYPREKKT